MKKSAIEGGNNYVSYFMGSMALGARARLKVNEIVSCRITLDLDEIVPRVGLHWIYTTCVKPIQDIMKLHRCFNEGIYQPLYHHPHDLQHPYPVGICAALWD